MSTFLDDYQREQRQRAERLPKYKAALIRLLRRIDAESAVIYYDGEGDSGQIESITVHDAQDNQLPDKALTARSQKAFAGLHLLQATLHGALEAFAWELLAIHHDGFENNDGAYGTIILDIERQTTTIEHNARVSDVFTTTTEV